VAGRECDGHGAQATGQKLTVTAAKLFAAPLAMLTDHTNDRIGSSADKKARRGPGSCGARISMQEPGVGARTRGTSVSPGPLFGDSRLNLAEFLGIEPFEPPLELGLIEQSFIGPFLDFSVDDRSERRNPFLFVF
jgi:hypothetical protein